MEFDLPLLAWYLQKSHTSSPATHSNDNKLAQGHGEERNDFQLEKVSSRELQLKTNKDLLTHCSINIYPMFPARL